MTDCFFNYYFNGGESGKKRNILKKYKEGKCVAYSKRQFQVSEPFKYCQILLL